ncbi:MAG: hypothetical protein AB2693_06300, partial [Candidatus Thiodiazotropha sp.]
MMSFALGLTSAIVIRENVVYHKISNAGLTRSQWLISLIIELKPYNDFLLKLTNDINSVEHLAIKLEEKYKPPEKEGFLVPISKLRREINSLKYTQLELMAQYNYYRLLKSRKKRALFSFLEGPINALFGVITEDQVASLRANMANLAKNQVDISHVLEESLSIINTSRLSIDRNRQTINDILNSLSDMDRKMETITGALELQIHELSHFVQVYTQLDLVVEELKRFMLKGLFLIEHLKVQLSFMSLSKLSTSIVNPFEFQRILADIGSKLPPNLRLPSKPKDGLWAYYHTLELTTVLEEDRIIVIIVLPLMQYDNHFEIYKAINLPVPLMNEAIKTSDTHTMVARYDLESAGLAINLQRTKYVLLTDSHLKACTNPRLGVCNMKLPIYPVNLSNKCIVALFLNSRGKITEFCHKTVMPNSYVPQAIYIADGLWIIISQKELRFSVTCQKSNSALKSLIIKPPLDVVAVNSKCEASNDYLSLMPYYMSETKQEITDEFVSMVKENLNITSNTLWKPFLQNITHYKHTRIPNKLKSIKSIPMDSLIEELHMLRPMKPEIEIPNWAYGLISLGIALLVGIAIFVYCKYKHLLS